MEQTLWPRPEKGQFKAFVYMKPNAVCFEKVWCRHSLTLPPFALEPGFKHTWVTSHAVLGGGSHLCMSFRGFGTYCFDTAMGHWSHAGDWMLPLYGKAEYLPELNLWFGISKDHLPGVCDLSSALNGEKPELCRLLGNDYYPVDWEPFDLPHIISLGSRRLCILDLLQTNLEDTYTQATDQVVDKELAVFTGVELLAVGNGNGSGAGAGSGKEKVIQMISHKSRFYIPDGTGTIERVF